MLQKNCDVNHLQIYAPMETLYVKNITDCWHSKIFVIGMATKLIIVECLSLKRLPSTGMDSWYPASIFEILTSGMYGRCPASWGSKYAPGSMNFITSPAGLQVTAQMVLVLQIWICKREVQGRVSVHTLNKTFELLSHARVTSSSLSSYLCDVY